jgi:Spy/CpxP family protein refolding chaperone
MKRFSGRLCAMIAAAVVVAMIAQGALAQNESKKGRGGRGGAGGGGMMGGPPSMVRIAGNEKVQEALKVSDDQKSKIEKINEESRSAMREQFQGGGRPDPEKMRKMRDEETEKLDKVLDEAQQKRLMGIFVQVMGAGAVMDPAVGKAIGLTDDQKSKLREAMGPPPEGRAAGGQGFQERREKMEKEVMSVLTEDQKSKLESLKGEKVDIDPASLRGGGRGQDGRQRRNRGGAEKKSAA